MKKQASILWLLSVFFDGFGTVVGFLFYILPYHALKYVLDLFTRDGDAKPFTPALNASVHPAAVLICLLGLVGCFLLVLKKRQAEAKFTQLLIWLSEYLRHLTRGYRCFTGDLRAVRLARWEAVLISILTLLASWLRLLKINQPMDYDEAYTYIAFASKSVWTILSDYHLPNNHVLHSLLVHTATLITGSEQPWSVRLPAFFAGILIVPAIYLLARQLYNRPTAIVTVSLVVINPFMIEYSVNARGYSLLALLTILNFVIGYYLLHHNNSFAWLLLSVICALGFYTVPVMLYPFGILIAWLCLSGLVGDLSPEYISRKVFLIPLFVASITAGLLTLFFYAPILLVSGTKDLFANQFVLAVPWDQFFSQLRIDVVNTWNNNWFVNIPVWGRTVLMLSFLFSLILHRKISTAKIPTQAVAFAWIGLALLVQRPATFPRTWVFLLPLFLMWCASGLVAVIEQIHLPKAARLQPIDYLNLVVIAGLSFSVLHQSIASPLQFQLDKGAARSTIEHLQGVLEPGDMIVFAFPVDAPLQYYAQILGVPQIYFYLPNQKDRTFTRVFLIVSPNYGQTIDSVLQARDLDPNRFDLDGRQIESDFGIYTIYRVYPIYP